MSKIADAFDGKKAFIAYLMAGDPNIEKSAEYILAAQDAGADLIEIGIPFSDPIAEGEVIQKASVRAITAGARLDGVFEMVMSIKNKIRIPLVFMTYLNPVFVYGYERFFKKCREVGICGIIIPDMPFEEQSDAKAIATRYGVELIALVAPTSKKRAAMIAENAEGFIYLVSSLGVTGARNQITTDVNVIVDEIRKVATLPIAIGFGINTPEQARELSQKADGVIVGSAIIKLIEQYGKNAETQIYNYIKQMKEATL